MPRVFAFPAHLILIVLLLSPCCAVRAQASDEESTSQSEVARLIEQLGSESYATRVRARERLQRMGLEAFDELSMAQFHSDSEISLAARFLVNSLIVSWSKESDPPEVRDALTEYGAQNEVERSSRIEMLAEFSSRKGLPALVRLVRFETKLRLSRQAALSLMQQPMSNDPAQRRRNAEQILQILEDNDRQAASWLRVYAKDLANGEYSGDRWRELIAAQREEIDSASTQQSTRPSVLELVRVCATRAAAAGQVDEALDLARQHMDLVAPKSTALVDACNWAIDNNLHPFVLDLRKMHTRMFDRKPILLYGAAEAKRMAGDKAEAEELAARALAIRPLPTDDAEKAKLQPKEIEETAQAHRELGKKLEERGLFDWAEREFRLIIDAMEVNATASASARSDLAQMLSDLERHKDVVSVLQPMNDRIEKDAKFRQVLVSNMIVDPSRVRSDVEYHNAIVMIEEGKVEDAKEMLVRAFRMYPPNVDILIRMYHMDGDDDWRRTVHTSLQRTIRQVEGNVKEAQVQARQLGRNADEEIGYFLNQYAWLVSNTEGDYQKALNYSLKSLELGADYAKLDTCARCYFAVGDLDNAIRMQRRALKMMPHSPPLRRQLAELEAAAAKADSASNENE